MKRRLSKEEKEALLSVASDLSEGKQISAILAYGSKVAGYAKRDSDYDLILIERRFAQGIRYRYVLEPLPTSALIVNENLLMEDATKAALGEFVVGRLLNIYEPILNADLIKRAEVEYKKRVIAELLVGLASDYGDFSQNLIIPLDYFLFDKLRRRATVYPPALYSYTKTYTCSDAIENKEFSLDGFREATSYLASEGILRVGEGSVRIIGDKLRGSAFRRLLTLFSLTTRGVKQYAVHGYAGRVGLAVFKKEALSKLRRMREKVNPPIALQRPKSLLRLDEGVIIDTPGKIVDELAKLWGFDSSYTHREKERSEIHTTSRILQIENEKGKVSFVLKHFSDIRSVKWALLSLWAFTATTFSMSPLSRLNREYTMLRRLREIGIKTPRVIAVAPDERILVREYIDGIALSSILAKILKEKSKDLSSVAEYAKVLARVHRAGISLGDARASNVLVSNGNIYLADLEQAVEDGDRAWDVAEFLYFTAKLSLKESGMTLIAESFLEAYRERGDPRVIGSAKSLKYLAPFQPLLALGMSRLLRDLMDSYSN